MTIIIGKEKKDYRIGDVGIQLAEDVKAEQLLAQQNQCMSLYADPVTNIAAPKPGPQPFALAMFMEVSKELEKIKERINALESLEKLKDVAAWHEGEAATKLEKKQDADT